MGFGPMMRVLRTLATFGDYQSQGYVRSKHTESRTLSIQRQFWNPTLVIKINSQNRKPKRSQVNLANCILCLVVLQLA